MAFSWVEVWGRFVLADLPLAPPLVFPDVSLSYPPMEGVSASTLQCSCIPCFIIAPRPVWTVRGPGVEMSSLRLETASLAHQSVSLNPDRNNSVSDHSWSSKKIKKCPIPSVKPPDGLLTNTIDPKEEMEGGGWNILQKLYESGVNSMRYIWCNF